MNGESNIPDFLEERMELDQLMDSLLQRYIVERHKVLKANEPHHLPQLQEMRKQTHNILSDKNCSFPKALRELLHYLSRQELNYLHENGFNQVRDVNLDKHLYFKSILEFKAQVYKLQAEYFKRQFASLKGTFTHIIETQHAKPEQQLLDLDFLHKQVVKLFNRFVRYLRNHEKTPAGSEQFLIEIDGFRFDVTNAISKIQQIVEVPLNKLSIFAASGSSESTNTAVPSTKANPEANSESDLPKPQGS